ncbi:MAG TPA: DNA repair protein RecO [Candidatus Magasanikbacteria bacterium]|nr:MAG: DNA repair protein RecO [Candidatus Magasanikbacteria bacterium RIFCSPLOWO2_02_FULL_47_16]OGH79309.1 MAG: DNA repair protein RecO [Candidatus Magasanikbacteria bacterium RIFCSPHIGHO2_02_FULL_48_18]OGH81897.1 MAG: DNA repair protein RecO [Candidatus Magasanikbacteria bacterium RIFCSPLOWO2_12_FULL_47_9b]HAZ28419.1 DNA repair protein RecO [Candidatus Magasanikbacteria bacterium]
MQSLILSRKDFREYDQIISAYTVEQGKIQVLARGVKKITSKHGCHLEPVSFVDLTIVPGKELSHLIKVQPIIFFQGIQADMRKRVIAGYLVSLIDRVLEDGQGDAGLFSFFREFFLFLNSAPAVHPFLVDAFLMRFFDRLGFRPLLGACMHCGKDMHTMIQEHWKTPRDGIGFFSIREGGMVCPLCASKDEGMVMGLVPCDEKNVNTMLCMINGSWEMLASWPLDDSERSKIQKIAHQFVEYHAERTIPDFSVVERVYEI